MINTLLFVSCLLTSFTGNYPEQEQTCYELSSEGYSAKKTAAVNPILPDFHADPEILYSTKTKKYYIYSTTDGTPGWGGHDFSCFSSTDLRHWKDEGKVLDVATDQVTWATGNAWAPAAIEKDNKYYLYFSAHNPQSNRKEIGCAVSDSPTGPFVDSGHPIISDKDRPAGLKGGQAIDVDVFQDPRSGKYYIYWGNCFMAGAELNDDMTSIKPETTVNLTPKGGTLADYNYREGTYVFYRKGTYYFMWSVDDTGADNYHVAYGTSKSPLGPVTVAKQPIVLRQNPSLQIYGTAHNSVLQIPGKDEWYIIYHRINPDFRGSKELSPGTHRQVCIDRMLFNSDGTIKEVRPTHDFPTLRSVKKNKQKTDREYWAALAYKMAQPVLENMSKGELRKNMQTEFSPSFDKRDRRVVYMETFGRLMAGIAPWIALPDETDDAGNLTKESKQRRQLREWALASYKNAVDPQSPDYLCWGVSGQNLVDAAYIAESFLRAYDALWMPLDSLTKARYIHEFQGLRKIDPPYTNWLLFSSEIESFLAKTNVQGACHEPVEWDEFRVNMACRKCEEWYVGDGWFSDGPVFAFNYYTSYVFHPMYLETLQAMVDAKVNSRLDYKKYYDRELTRTQKYSIILERFISPEGTFPVIGRSTPYRMAAMQPLALMAWYKSLPNELSNGQVRAALTKVLHRMFDQQNNFNEGGYLTIGFCGSQPETADWYTNNGSLYMTTLAFMPLGLPETDPFWTDEAEPWTQVKAWNGMPFPKDHHWVDQIQTHDKW